MDQGRNVKNKKYILNHIINDNMFNNTRVKVEIFWVTEKGSVYRNNDDIQKNVLKTILM